MDDEKMFGDEFVDETYEDEMDNIIVLLDEDGQEIEFEHLDSILYQGDTYLVLLPVVSDYDEENDQVAIFKAERDENGEDTLVVVEDEDVLDAVFEEFKIHSDGEFEFVEDDNDEDDSDI